MDASVTTEISYTMKAGIIFEEDELSESISSTIGDTFSMSQTKALTVSGTCDYNEDGTAFTTGCLYQIVTTNKNTYNGKTLTW